MDPLTATAASGLRARMESLDLLANNVANASTGGYKADREFYSLYAGSDADSDPASTMPLIQREWTDYSQGSLRTTDNALDLALSGPGFFTVQGPNGPLYTRNGSFRLSSDGQVTTAEGYAVLDASGQPLTVSAARPFQILKDGSVRQAGETTGQLAIAAFPDGALTKQGGSYFRAADPSYKPAAASATVEQGKLEDSNSGAAESAVRLVGVMRQFEMMQKAILIGSDMSKQAIEQVAKVGA